MTMTIADRGVLVNLSISQWSAAKSDKKVNREIAEKHGSDESMGNFRKYLIARDAVKKYTELAASIRQEHYKLTLPWSDAGDRVLTSAGYFTYAEKFRNHERNLRQVWEEFFANYDAYAEDGLRKNGDLGDRSEFPTLAQLRRKFNFQLDISPISTANDFRVNLASEEITRLQTQFQRSADDRLNRAMQDVWTRMQTVVSAMADRLKLYQVSRDGVKNPFRDTLVSNIADLLDIIPALNLTGDPNVTAFADQMRELVKYDADVLRNVEKTRTDIASRADEILNKMQAFIA